MSVISRQINHMQIRLASTQKTFCSSCLRTMHTYSGRNVFIYLIFGLAFQFSSLHNNHFFRFVLFFLSIPLTSSSAFPFCISLNDMTERCEQNKTRQNKWKSQAQQGMVCVHESTGWRNVMKNVSTKSEKFTYILGVRLKPNRLATITICKKENPTKNK